MADLSEKVTDDGENCHIFRQAAKSVNVPNDPRGSAVRRLVQWLTPYTMRHFPGRYKIWHIMSPGYRPNTVSHWLTGHANPPPAMLRHWAQLAKAYLETGRQIVDDLEAAAAELESRPRHDPSENLRRYRLKKRSTTTL